MQKGIFILLTVFLFFSCNTLSYSEKSFLKNEGKPVALKDQDKNENINGSFPDKIYIKTMTQTFGFEYEFLIDDGKIYYKKTGTSKKEWKLYLDTGLPYLKKKDKPACLRVTEICADADCLYAFSDDGKLYRTYLKKITHYKPFEWVDYFGWPKKIPLYQTSFLKDKISWCVGSSRKDVEYYEDYLKNQHNYGPLGVESICFLMQDGKSIHYSDPACPSDFSHSFKFPDDDLFEATNISESASTIFLIGTDGTMYTRLADYNTVGSDPMLYEYTYEKVYSDLKGDNSKSNTTPWYLPNEPWKKQSPLPEGAKPSRYITIIQTGKGNSSRELRVAALAPDGTKGYYSKNIDEDEWSFHKYDFCIETFIEKNDSAKKENPHIYKYKGYLWKDNVLNKDIECSVNNFCFSEGPFVLSINNIKTNEKRDIKIYFSEIWNPFLRLNPGEEQEPVRYFGTAPEEKNYKIHDLYIEAFSKYLLIKYSDKNNDYVFYLTDDGIVKYNPKINTDIFVKNELLSRKENENTLQDELKRLKDKKSSTQTLSGGINFAVPFAKILLIDKFSRKVKIIVSHTREITRYNKIFYKNEYINAKRFSEYMADYEKILATNNNFSLKTEMQQLGLFSNPEVFVDKKNITEVVFFCFKGFFPFVITLEDEQYKLYEVENGLEGFQKAFSDYKNGKNFELALKTADKSSYQKLKLQKTSKYFILK